MLFKPKRKIIDDVQEWLTSRHKTDNWWSNQQVTEARNFLPEPNPQDPLSSLAQGLVTRHSKHPRRKNYQSLLLFLIILLMGAALVGYFFVRKIQLNASQELIRDCEGQAHCPGLIEALERLAQAKQSLQSYNLSSSHLASANLAGANFYRANLAEANLSNSSLFQANLSNSYLFQVNLQQAHLFQANLYDAYLEQANLFQANLEQADLSNANLEQANLEQADLSNANLFQANLKQAHLSSSKLDGTYFVRANLTEANLTEANLHFANLIKADLHSTNLIEANLHSTNLIEAQNLTPSQIKSACYWTKAVYKANWNQVQWKWIVNHQANQQYIEQLQQDQASEPDKPVDCSRWEQSS